MIDPAAARLLRRHVGSRAEDHTSLGPRSINGGGRCVIVHVLDELCQTKINDLRMTVVSDDDVGGLEIAENDALLVGAGETLGDLGCEGERSPV
ncbi:hypothetical protein BH18ACI5_BH18ACI5_22540 [soil metagenome]